MEFINRKNMGKILPWLLLVISVTVHFLYFGHPNSVVFDEVHIGNYISNYLNGNYFFDVHPPFAKMLLMIVASFIGNGDALSSFEKIGNVLPQWVILLRSVPTLLGVFLPLLVYGILRNLNLTRGWAFIAGLLLCIENSLIVQSKFLLVDSIILFFGFLSLYLYFKYKNLPKDATKSQAYVLAGGAILSGTFAFSAKWIGLSFFGLIILFEIFDRGRKSIKFVSAALAILIIFYVGIFYVHFKILPKSGPGDAFMTERFQLTLEGNQFVRNNPNAEVPKISFAEKFVELNDEMVRANNSLTTPHAYSSMWYTWPLMKRPIYYWQSVGIPDSNGIAKDSHIYSIGNPFVYWFGLIAMILIALNLIIRLPRTNNIELLKDYIKKEKTTIFVVVGYLANFLPFMLIGRVMFLYHYAPALVFSVMAIVVLLSKIRGYRTRVTILVLMIFITSASFLFFSPLTYGLPLTNEELQARMWFPTWR